MTLADVVRGGVALANKLTGPLQVTVQQYVWTGSQDGFGKPILATTPTPRQCIWVKKQRVVRTLGGTEGMTANYYGFLDAGSVSKFDKIVAPDGSTGPILNFEGMGDAGAVQAGTLFTIEVWQG